MPKKLKSRSLFQQTSKIKDNKEIFHTHFYKRMRLLNKEAHKIFNSVYHIWDLFQAVTVYVK